MSPLDLGGAVRAFRAVCPSVFRWLFSRRCSSQRVRLSQDSRALLRVGRIRSGPDNVAVMLFSLRTEFSRFCSGIAGDESHSFSSLEPGFWLCLCGSWRSSLPWGWWQGRKGTVWWITHGTGAVQARVVLLAAMCPFICLRAESLPGAEGDGSARTRPWQWV